MMPIRRLQAFLIFRNLLWLPLVVSFSYVALMMRSLHGSCTNVQKEDGYSSIKTLGHHNARNPTRLGPTNADPSWRLDRNATLARLKELIQSPPNDANLSCPPPLVPVYDRFVNHGDSQESHRNIPRLVHISMKSRCMPFDMAIGIDKWKAALPKHSVVFHDDEAVDRLLHQEWPEFPHLDKVLQCVKYKGAMLIDIWRILVVYEFGGVYTDIDNWPNDKLLTEDDPIQAGDDAFFLSDAWKRPSQWFFAMEPRHPIAYYTMLEILQRVMALSTLNRPKVVFVTGPDALKFGYGRFLDWTPKHDIFYKEGLYQGKLGKTARKLIKGEYVIGKLGNTYDDMVLWKGPQRETQNITRRQRIERESGVLHWTKVRQRKADSFEGSCQDYLYALDNRLANNASFAAS